MVRHIRPPCLALTSPVPDSKTSPPPFPPRTPSPFRAMKWVFRVMALMFIPAGNYVAAGTALLWVSNTAFGVGQGMLLRSHPVRARLGLPSMEVRGIWWRGRRGEEVGKGARGIEAAHRRGSDREGRGLARDAYGWVVRRLQRDVCFGFLTMVHSSSRCRSS